MMWVKVEHSGMYWMTIEEKEKKRKEKKRKEKKRKEKKRKEKKRKEKKRKEKVVHSHDHDISNDTEWSSSGLCSEY